MAGDSLKPDFARVAENLKKKNAVDYTNFSGVSNQFQQELKPVYDQTTAEIVYPGKTNCLIILGQDRPGSPDTGYGKAGGGGSATIDIVAGHLGKRLVDGIPASKNLDLDSSRIYISEKTDVDANFNIPQFGAETSNQSISLEDSTGRAAIAVKSDCVRLIARENIKIVTQHLGDTSIDGSKTLNGIDLIAGCDVPGLAVPQPMVKGNNLAAALSAIILAIEEVQANMSDFIDLQMKINSEIMSHTHQDSACGITSTIIQDKTLTNITSMMKKIIPSIIATNMNFQVVMAEYLTSTSDKYINSLYNRVN